MIAAAIMPFPFHIDANTAQTYNNATLKYLGIGMRFVYHDVWFYPASGRFIRTRYVFDTVQRDDFIKGFVPIDATRIAFTPARTRRMKADREIEALKSAEAK